MVYKLGEDLLAGGLGHLLGDVGARLVDEQPVARQRVHVLGLAVEVRRAGYDDRHQPRGVGERYQPPVRGALPEKTSMRWTSSGLRMIRVNDSHLDASTSPVEYLGAAQIRDLLGDVLP